MKIQHRQINFIYHNSIQNHIMYNPNLHHRRSIRLKGYNYSNSGLYFLTICVKDKRRLFGTVENEKMVLNDAGRLVEQEWLALFERYSHLSTHEYIIMPNHFHAILEIKPLENPNGKTLGMMIGEFQSIVTVKYIRMVRSGNFLPFNGKLWQRNYYEHIIRNEEAYQNITNYIRTNPERWKS